MRDVTISSSAKVRGLMPQARAGRACWRRDIRCGESP